MINVISLAVYRLYYLTCEGQTLMGLTGSDVIAASAGEQPPILDIYLDFCLLG